MTRTSDVFIPLPRRVAIANARKNALFVSVHFNSAPREGACGYETFYYSRGSARTASRIQSQLLRTHRTENRGVKRRGFYVLRYSRNPAVLVECGFLTNRREATLCRTAAHRQKIAEAIARGILASR
jgi:N-acetylmuramoyl-L-alanine amidase